MEHTKIAPAGDAILSPEMIGTLAHHGLRELLFAPIPKVARALAGFNRDQLGNAIEIMIAMLDAADGDPDAEIEDRAGETVPVIENPEVPSSEDDGDPDLEETGAEDSFVIHHGTYPGCPISDPGEAVGDEQDTSNAEDEPTTGFPAGFGSGGAAGCSLSDGEGDRSYAEWQTLPAATRQSGAIDGRPVNDWGQGVHEDAEEDDGDTGVEDEPKGFDPEEDMCSAGDDRVSSGPVTRGGSVGGYDYPGSEDDAEGEQMSGDVPMPPVYSLDYNIFTDKRLYVGNSNLMTSFQANGSKLWSADTGNPHTWNGDITKPGVPV